MSENSQSRRNNSSAYNFEESITEILGALEQIKKNIPNGEVKVLNERISKIEDVQQELKNDLREIKRLLMDPESGLIVKLNKATDHLKQNEEYFDEIKPKIDSIPHLDSFKDNVTKLLWIMASGIAATLLGILFK